MHAELYQQYMKCNNVNSVFNIPFQTICHIQLTPITSERSQRKETAVAVLRDLKRILTVVNIASQVLKCENV